VICVRRKKRRGYRYLRDLWIDMDSIIAIPAISASSSSA